MPYLCVLKDFCSIEKIAIVVITRHFDSLFNDDCPTEGWAIITVSRAGRCHQLACHELGLCSHLSHQSTDGLELCATIN